MWFRPSAARRMGGRPAAVISAQRAWKMGHAASGSRAPSSARRVRVVLGGTGMGRAWVCLTTCLERMSLLALAIWLRRVAV